MEKENKSRAKYFRERRKDFYSIGILVTLEEGKKLDTILKKKNLTKTDWIKEKIEEDFKKIK